MLSLALLVLMLQPAPARKKTRVIEHPAFTFVADDGLVPRRIELTDTATLVHFTQQCRTDWQLAATACLVTGGRQYRLRGGTLFTRRDGRLTGSMPLPTDSLLPGLRARRDDGSVQDSLLLRFDPVPAKAATVDFTEEPGVRKGWYVPGIRLDGKLYPSLLSQEEPLDTLAGLPPYEPRPGEARLRLRPLGTDHENSRYFFEIGWFAHLPGDFSNCEETRIDTLADSTRVYCVAAARPVDKIAFPGFTGMYKDKLWREALLVPGEELTVEADYPALVARTYLPGCADLPFMRYRGKFAPLTRISYTGYPRRSLVAPDEATLPPDEYVERAWRLRGERMDWLAAQEGLSPMQRDYLRLRIEKEYIHDFASFHFAHLDAARRRREANPDSVRQTKAAEFGRRGWGDAHAPQLTLGDDSRVLYTQPASLAFLPYMEANGLTGTRLYRLLRERRYALDLLAQIADAQPVRPAQWDTLAPVYRDYVEPKNKALLADLARMEQAGNDRIRILPDVPSDSLLAALLAPYAGRVVVVDYWATWCGPCKRGIADMRAMKEELGAADVVFVYLADEGSPVADWLEAIEGIPGLHYRLTRRYAKAAERIGLAGYPRYTVFDRTGRKVYGQLGYAPAILAPLREAIGKALGE